MRKRIYGIIESASEKERLSNIYDIFMMIVILASVVQLCFKTEYFVLIIIDKIALVIFLCLARIFLPLSHIGTTPRGCGTKKLKYSCLLCGRRKESPGFFFAGMQRRGPGMKKWRFLSLKSSRIKISHSPFFD